jgi:hypothetical protein
MPRILPIWTDVRFEYAIGLRSISASALLPLAHANGPTKPQITTLRIPSTSTVVPCGCSICRGP